MCTKHLRWAVWPSSQMLAKVHRASVGDPSHPIISYMTGGSVKTYTNRQDAVHPTILLAMRVDVRLPSVQ